ncbi:MAG: helix-turn-helix domain-containing protein [Nitrolancea sp.]
MENITQNVFYIRDAETMKVISDPLRLRIFGLLQGEARTVKELASELDAAPTRLYYHMNQLESLGLIEVAETRVVAGIIEKHYRAAATRIAIDRAIFNPGVAPVDQAVEAMLTGILDGSRDAIRDVVRRGLVDPQLESPGEGGLLLGRRWLRLTQDEAGEFYDRLVALLHEFAGRHQPDADADIKTYEALLGLYPVTEHMRAVEDDGGADV